MTPKKHIVCAYAEYASGPGWSNSPLWVIVLNRTTGEMTTECIQPADQTPVIRALFPISAPMHDRLKLEATSVLKKRGQL